MSRAVCLEHPSGCARVGRVLESRGVSVGSGSLSPTLVRPASGRMLETTHTDLPKGWI